MQHARPGRTSGASGHGDSDDDEDDEVIDIQPFVRPRRGGVCAEPWIQGYFKEKYWTKHEAWETILREVMREATVFKQFGDKDLERFIRPMETHLRYDGEVFAEEGERADSLYVVLEGTLACYQSGKAEPVARKTQGALLDEAAVLFAYPRRYLMKAEGECIVAKLTHSEYVTLCTRMAFRARSRYKHMLKNSKMLEMMEDEALEKLCDAFTLRRYQAGDNIVTQGESGQEFYLITSGTARVWVKSGDDEQEYVRLQKGNLFGERALLKNEPRAASVTAVTEVEVLVLSRGKFERLLGSMDDLQQQQYLTDPRKLIADFYQNGDSRGPGGSIARHKMKGTEGVETQWFVVYRPTSKDAIAKMLSGAAVGKGLNVKGKSAKKGVLSGFVPFVQISENEHKKIIEDSPPDSRIVVYYKTKAAREEARKALQAVLDTAHHLKIEMRSIVDEDSYKPDVWGLEMPEPLMREAYIIQKDISPVMGWETGRRSEPAFMDMNLHAIRGKSDPQVVLYQNDEADIMNPRGLLIAYAEVFVKPVVSDFDTFTVGSKNMVYESLPSEQAQLILWLLEHTEGILKSLDHQSWNSRWLEVLAKENERGFHPVMLGRRASGGSRYTLIQDATHLQDSPVEELDDEYLIVWQGFTGKPWDYKTEAGLREFLLERAQRLVERVECPTDAFFELRRPCSQLSGKFACKSSQVVNNVLCAYIKQIYIYIYESQLIG
ncbi:unnamed protein product [Durusdinium trenchii]|uniref:Cyclic nucleotide-binding domain-containing protein n=1 Tax=Durusdinium trenchii TaxID=1381693 RepID=A0ABP0QKB3_9DINO